MNYIFNSTMARVIVLYLPYITSHSTSDFSENLITFQFMQKPLNCKQSCDCTVNDGPFPNYKPVLHCVHMQTYIYIYSLSAHCSLQNTQGDRGSSRREDNLVNKTVR